MRLSRTLAALVACILALGTQPAWATSMQAGPPASASTSGWREVPVPTFGIGGPDALSALGPSSAWAVGGALGATGYPSRLVLHWNGKKWLVAPTAGIPASVWLNGVDARSDRDIVADGTDGASDSFVYRFNGSRWMSLPRPKAAEGGDVAPYTASFSPGGQIWAFGWINGGPAFFELTAKGWRSYRTGVTANAYLSSPMFVSQDDAWSVGTVSRGGPFSGLSSLLLLHFNGKTWSKVTAPPLPRTAMSAALDGIVAVREHRGDRLWLSGNWAPCENNGGCANRPFVVTGGGTHWTSEPLPSAVTSVNGLSPDRRGLPQWTVATTSNPGSSYYLRYSRGAFRLVRGVTISGQSSPDMTVVHIPGTDATWAVGWASDGPTPAWVAGRIELNGDLP